MSDFWENADYGEWEDAVRREVIPMLQSTAACISLVPKVTTDVRFAVELGLAIMMDKPIIALVRPGSKISAALARAADELVEVDIRREPDAAQRSISAAYERVMRSRLGHVALEDAKDDD